jgi:hypothetical protein
MNIQIDPQFENTEIMRAFAAFLTMAADLRDGETKDGPKLSSAVQVLLNDQPQATVGCNGASAQPEVSTGEAAGDGAGVEAVPAAVEAPAAPVKRTRRKKAEMEAERAAESNVNATEVQTRAAEVAAEKHGVHGGEGATLPTAESFTIDDVRAALQRYTAANSMPQGIALLKNYGAGRISELREDQYSLFISECDAQKEAA